MSSVLDNGVLRVEVSPSLGGTIQFVRHLGLGASVLGSVPWEASDLPETSGAAADEASWLTRFGGGWPVMFPNAGDACIADGARHGFHGEASVSPFACAREGEALVLSRRFLSVPARMTRRISIEGDRLTVEETVEADAPCEVMWGQHVTLGSDLLAGPVEIAASATRATACASYAPPASPLRPGTESEWPVLPGRRGLVNLSRPREGAAMLACLMKIGPAPWVELHRRDDLAVRLDWTADPWPLAWLWVETGGTQNAPWFGRGRVVGVEPCTTWPAAGLSRAREAGGRLLRIEPGRPRSGRVTLRVFRPDPPT